MGIEVWPSAGLVLGHLNVLIQVYLLAKHFDNTGLRLLLNWVIEPPGRRCR